MHVHDILSLMAVLFVIHGWDGVPPLAGGFVTPSRGFRNVEGEQGSGLATTTTPTPEFRDQFIFSKKF